MALIDDFEERFAEFGYSDIETVFPSLESSWPSYYGGQYDAANKEIILQLIAHLLTIEAEMNNTMGGVIDDSGDFFNLTKYGQNFRMLIKHNGGIASV